MPAIRFFTRCLALLLVAGVRVSAQPAAPAWQHVEEFGIDGYCFATAINDRGDVYVTGILQRWESDNDPESGLSSAGSNAFVAKWNTTARRLAWLVRMGSQHNDVGTAIVVAGTNVYVAGYFSKETEGFGHPLKATGNQDAFVARLTDHGDCASVEWTQPLGYPLGSTSASFLALDGAALYVAGTTTNWPDSTSAETGGSVVRTRNFLGKLDPGGRQGWQRTWPVARTCQRLVGLVARQREVYLAAATWQDTPMPFEPVDAQREGTLPHQANYRLHLTRFCDQGATCHRDWTWTEAGQAAGLAVADDALYVVGREDADQPFGKDLLPASAQDVPGDLFIARLLALDTTARPVWVRRLRGTGRDEGSQLSHVAVRGRQVYVAGTFGAPQLVLDSCLVLPNAKPSAQNDGDLFVAQLTDAGASGQFDWAQRLGSTAHDRMEAVAFAGAWLYVRGLFQGARGAPVWLGQQQLELAGFQETIQAWLPLGPPGGPAGRPAR